MDKKNIVTCTNRLQWREWLNENHKTCKEVWLVFPTKASKENGVSYNDAVEEALCFGWIDGRAGTLDALHHIRRFTPRRKGSAYSRPNIERLIWLARQGMLLPEVKEEVEEIIAAPFEYPEDILAQLKTNAAAWEHYQTFTEAYKRIRIAYIDAARNRPEEFNKRLKNFIVKTEQNKLIVGYGGIEKYYR